MLPNACRLRWSTFPPRKSLNAVVVAVVANADVRCHQDLSDLILAQILLVVVKNSKSSSDAFLVIAHRVNNAVWDQDLSSVKTATSSPIITLLVKAVQRSLSA